MLLQGCAGLHMPIVQFGACQGLIHAIVTPFWAVQASQYMGLHNLFKTWVESDASEAPVSCLAWPLEQLPPIQQKYQTIVIFCSCWFYALPATLQAACGDSAN